MVWRLLAWLTLLKLKKTFSNQTYAHHSESKSLPPTANWFCSNQTCSHWHNDHEPPHLHHISRYWSCQESPEHLDWFDHPFGRRHYSNCWYRDYFTDGDLFNWVGPWDGELCGRSVLISSPSFAAVEKCLSSNLNNVNLKIMSAMWPQRGWCTGLSLQLSVSVIIHAITLKADLQAPFWGMQNKPNPAWDGLFHLKRLKVANAWIKAENYCCLNYQCVYMSGGN